MEASHPASIHSVLYNDREYRWDGSAWLDAKSRQFAPQRLIARLEALARHNADQYWRCHYAHELSNDEIRYREEWEHDVSRYKVHAEAC